jgi:hypothetical protein
MVCRKNRKKTQKEDADLAGLHPDFHTRPCVAWVTIFSSTYHYTPIHKFLLCRTPPLWFKVRI